MGQASESADGIPAFLAKLWKLVDESRTNHLICWGPGGRSFIIKNQIDFAKNLLPLYYKHNNMASFIRQLNMYGFHKVVSVEDGSLKSDNEEIQFSHKCFLKGHVCLLQHIKRKIASSRTTTVNSTEGKALLKSELMTEVLTDVKQVKGRQDNLDARFSAMKHENEALWREVALLRQKHIKQQQIVNNLIQFIMSILQPSRNGPLKTSVKRGYQLMINAAAHNSNEDMENRSAKCARLDSDNELEEEDDEIEIALEDMLEDDGPIIHEVGDQDHNDILIDDKTGIINDNFSNSSTVLKKELLDSTQATQSSPSNFDSDEANSQDDMFLAKDPEDFLLYMIQNQNNSQKEQNTSTVADNANVMNSLSNGCYNPNISVNTLSSKGKSKNKVKKQKSQESLLRIKEVVSPKGPSNKNDKTLAILTNDNSRPVLNRFNSVENADDLRQFKINVDNIRDLLQANYSLDANSLPVLYDQEPRPAEIIVEKDKDTTGQLTSYIPSIEDLGFDDIDTSIKEYLGNLSPVPPVDDTLNTPIVQLPEPRFPAGSSSAN